MRPFFTILVLAGAIFSGLYFGLPNAVRELALSAKTASAQDVSVVIDNAGFQQTSVTTTIGSNIVFNNASVLTVTVQTGVMPDFSIVPGGSVSKQVTQSTAFNLPQFAGKANAVLTVNVTPATTPQPTTAPQVTAVPTAQPTKVPVPTVQPTVQPAQVLSQGCRLDKVATLAEVSIAGPQRIEVGGGGTQHVDFYPDRGKKAVSYIVPPSKPARWMGFGSIWEAPNSVECQSFDWVTDTTNYAKGRLGEAHSGLVVDMRVTPAKVVANVAGLTKDQIQEILAVQRAAQNPQFDVQVDLSQLSASAPATAQASAPAPAASSSGQASAPAQGCPPAQEVLLDNKTDNAINGPAIVHPWWNNGKPSFGQTQVKTIVPGGQTVTLLEAKGKVYMYQNTSACVSNLDKEFANANFPVKAVVELRAEGLVQ